jgi:hypothetical protein
MTQPKTSSPATLLVAWLWTAVPLLWGITQTLRKALALFE